VLVIFHLKLLISKNKKVEHIWVFHQKIKKNMIILNAILQLK